MTCPLSRESLISGPHQFVSDFLRTDLGGYSSALIANPIEGSSLRGAINRTNERKEEHSVYNFHEPRGLELGLREQGTGADPSRTQRVPPLHLTEKVIEHS